METGLVQCRMTNALVEDPFNNRSNPWNYYMGMVRLPHPYQNTGEKIDHWRAVLFGKTSFIYRRCTARIAVGWIFM